MDTKEAIEWLKDAEEIAELNKWRIDKVIELLQRGEKFEQMWEEFQYYVLGIAKALPNKINELEQKYFPKPKKEGD